MPDKYVPVMLCLIWCLLSLIVIWTGGQGKNVPHIGYLTIHFDVVQSKENKEGNKVSEANRWNRLWNDFPKIFIDLYKICIVASTKSACFELIMTFWVFSIRQCASHRVTLGTHMKCRIFMRNKTENPFSLQDDETFDKIDKTLLWEPNGPLLNPFEP